MLTWLLNWLRDIPAASVLRERVAALEADAKKKDVDAAKKQAETEAAHLAEKTELQGDVKEAEVRAQAAETAAQNLQLQLDDARAQIQRFEEELVKKERQKRHLETEEIQILVLLSERVEVHPDELFETLNVSKIKFDYCVHRLKDTFKLIDLQMGRYQLLSYTLTQPGRVFLLEHKLVE